MLVLAANDTIAGKAPTGGSEVTCSLFLMELNTGTGEETYKSDQQQLLASEVGVDGEWTPNFQSTSGFYSVAYGNGYWVVGGTSGDIYYTTDPAGSWTANHQAETGNFYSVAYGNGYWVAVGSSGTCWYTTDPTGSWTDMGEAFASAGYPDMLGVEYGNGYWVACGNAGALFYTNDPTVAAWPNISFGSTAKLSVTYEPVSGYWVCVGASGGVFYTLDPTQNPWTTNTQGSGAFRSVAYGNGYWAACGNTGLLYYTTDPTGSWTSNAQGSLNLRDIFYGNGYWVVVGGLVSGSPVMYYKATNPTGSWTSNTPTGGIEQVNSVAYANGYWVYVGQYAGSSNNLYYVQAGSLTIYTATANGPTFVRSIHVVNTNASNVSTFQLFTGGTAAANAITPVLTIPAGGAAIYEDGRSWTFYDNNGKPQKSGGFSRINVRQFINAGADTYVPSDGMKACIAIVTGGGGGGGGADTSAGGSADVGIGAGGGAGGTAIGFYTRAQIGASKALSIGSGGTGGSASGGNGNPGGDSTWDTTALIGTGGAAGTGSASTTQDSQAIAGALGGVPTGGTINITGGSADPGVAGSADMLTVDLVFGLSGKGGNSFWGSGGLNVARAQNSLTTDATAAGGVGLAYGAGGSGAIDLTSATGLTGGAGMNGIIIIIEFIG